jgi:uncharacterized protein YgiM (DUF1202 family)
VRVRYRPGLRAATTGLAAAGTHVRVLTSWNGWDHVRLPGGRTGWIYALYVRS